MFKEITPRRFEFPVDMEFDINWNGGDAYRSQVFNAISLSFPVGEKWIIDTVKLAVDTMPPEKKEVWLPYARDFIAQESTHSFVHKKYNDQLIRKGMVNWWEKKLIEQVEWGQRGTPLNQLASSVAYEHLTAVFCAALVQSEKWLNGADPRMARLWTWHSCEELEHKHFVFDLYRAIGGGSTRRILWFIWASSTFMSQYLYQLILNLHKDRTLFKISTLRQAVAFNFGVPGFFWVTTKGMLKFLNPWFKPKESNSDVLARGWLRENSGTLKKVRD